MLTLTFLVLILAIGATGCESTATHAPSFQQTRQLVTVVDGTGRSCEAAGDGVHAWLWRPDSNGVTELALRGEHVERTERFSEDRPTGVLPWGDRRRVILFTSHTDDRDAGTEDGAGGRLLQRPRAVLGGGRESPPPAGIANWTFGLGRRLRRIEGASGSWALLGSDPPSDPARAIFLPSDDIELRGPVDLAIPAMFPQGVALGPAHAAIVDGQVVVISTGLGTPANTWSHGTSTSVLPNADGSGVWVYAPPDAVYFHRLSVPSHAAPRMALHPRERVVPLAGSAGLLLPRAPGPVQQIDGLNGQRSNLAELEHDSVIAALRLDVQHVLLAMNTTDPGSQSHAIADTSMTPWSLTRFVGPRVLPNSVPGCDPDYHSVVIPGPDDQVFLVAYCGAVFQVSIPDEPHLVVLGNYDPNLFVGGDHHSEWGFHLPLARDRHDFVWFVSDTEGDSRGVSTWSRSRGVLAMEPALGTLHTQPRVVPLGDDRRALACHWRNDATYLIDLSPTVGAPIVAFGQSMLTDASDPAPLLFDVGTAPVGVTLDADVLSLPGSDTVIHVRVHQEATGAHREWASAPINSSAVASPTLAPIDSGSSEASIEYGAPCTVEVTLTDSRGSHVRWTWRRIRFERPVSLTERPDLRAFLLALFIGALAWAMSRVPGRLRSAGRLAVYVSTIAAGAGSALTDELNLCVFGMTLGGFFAIATLGGVVSPTVFRLLEPVEPFRYVIPLALWIPFLRRRLFARYVKRLRTRLDLERAGVREKEYASTPIRVVARQPMSAAPAGEKGARRSDAPEPTGVTDAELFELVATRDPEALSHVLIEAPGGRGKSALVRRLIVIALDRADEDASTPLPLLCDGDKASLRARARESLGADGFSEDLTTVMLSSGFFFFVADGLTEANVTSEMIREHVGDVGMAAVPLVLAGRPGGDHRDALTKSAACWIVVEPERLREAADVDRFLAAYGVKKDNIPEAVLAACADADGSYSPLMLRLALIVTDDAIATIGDLYAGAVGKVLEKAGVEFDAVLALCLETYWKTGERQLSYATAPNDRKELLKKLKECDLLVPASLNRADPKGANPRSVRFFHDSVQTYLTAVAIMREDDWRERFEEAAAQPRFEADPTGLTELAAMCVHAHPAPGEMKRHLEDTLERIARERSGALARDTILAASQIPSVGDALGAEASAAEAIQVARGRCGAAGITTLGAFCARLLRLSAPARS